MVQAAGVEPARNPGKNREPVRCSFACESDSSKCGLFGCLLHE